ncbi:MAG TPA: FmdB family zinc ribbon protein [Ktedonobacteraceae bacterium]|jgi:putative FmdB family regulatory protein|nr:FmdB family zinc ribbon protein [Ktedonobacteraceae bacterium]
MPTYEYLCKTCNHRFETWQKMTDEPLTICPECGGNIRRVLYPAGIVFKGSGFYKTDHANGSPVSENGHKNGHKPEGESSATTSTSSESSASAKPSESKEPAATK